MRRHKKIIRTTLFLFWLFTLFFIEKGNSQNYLDTYDQIITNTPAPDQVSMISDLIDQAVLADSIQSAIDVAHKFSVKKLIHP